MPLIFSLKTRDFLALSEPLKRVQKKIFIIDKEMLLTASNSDHSESDIEKKIFIILKESLNLGGNLINFHQKSIKVCHS